MNSNYFNAEKGIFSKLDIDKQIPEKLRLKQYVYNKANPPVCYPVFLKPEWGQNSNGIVRIENPEEYKKLGKKCERAAIPYMVQEAAPARNEYEIYYLRSPDNASECAYLSITQVLNSSDEAYPLNSIHNSSTIYRDITASFSPADLQKIWQIINVIGRFRMARLGVKADSAEQLIKGEYKIIEINLFLPMPLVLLCDNVERRDKFRIIGHTMRIAAKLVSTIPRQETRQWIFFRKMSAHYKTVS